MLSAMSAKTGRLKLQRMWRLNMQDVENEGPNRIFIVLHFPAIVILWSAISLA